ncbi:hypothetical protein SEA_ATUIN_214 [Arthrobacter phage Atuin]|nr:hypothetical protein SEA_ATUIN_13 [Arthrobacter phage Atuin]
MRRRKSGGISLGVAGILASALLTGCTPDGTVIDADYAQMCQDKTTEQRVEDTNCSDQGRAGGHYGWYFYNMQGNSHTLPAVGSKLSGGSTSIPAGKSYKAGVTSKGGTISRGGFGTSAKGSSGG